MASRIETITFLKLYKNQMAGDINGRVQQHQAAIKARRSAALSGPVGLNLIATGDSWFDYPLDGDLPGIRTDVLAKIPPQCAIKPEILSLAHYGYTSTQEMGLKRQKMLVDALTDPYNGTFDGILMSGGGNDIAGDALVLWLNDSRSVKGDYSQAINMPRFMGIIDSVMSSYRDLIAIRDEFLPGAPIFVHSYDYPLVNGKGVCALGPWLKPAFDFCGWTDEDKCNVVIASMMKIFAVMLDQLASVQANVVRHVRTQGVVLPSQWANELHPNADGFQAIAKRFMTSLMFQFPGRV